MKRFICLPIATGLLMLAGCATSTPTHVDEGPIRASSFNFVVNPPGMNANYSEKREGIHSLIKDAITSNLSKKGVGRATGGQGDVTVAYLVLVENNVSTAVVNDYFGYGRDTSGLADKAHKMATETSANPNYFEAGTLVIDIVDNHTHQLLSRTHTTQPVLRNAAPDVRKERIQAAVDAALQNVRFKF